MQGKHKHKIGKKEQSQLLNVLYDIHQKCLKSEQSMNNIMY